LNSVILDDPSNSSPSIAGSVIEEAHKQSNSTNKVDLSYGICQSNLLIQWEDYLR
jgi:hypothetical protein